MLSSPRLEHGAITADQTVAEGLVAAGIMDRAHAERSPFGNVLSQAIGGGDHELVAEITTVELEPGDALLLCTDGLNKHVADDEIVRRLVPNTGDARGACQALVSEALEGGGSDNVTVADVVPGVYWSPSWSPIRPRFGRLPGPGVVTLGTGWDGRG